MEYIVIQTNAMEYIEIQKHMLCHGYAYATEYILIQTYDMEHIVM